MKNYKSIIINIIKDNPDRAAEYHSGKTGVLGFFMGKFIKAVGIKNVEHHLKEYSKMIILELEKIRR